MTRSFILKKIIIKYNLLRLPSVISIETLKQRFASVDHGQNTK